MIVHEYKVRGVNNHTRWDKLPVVARTTSIGGQQTDEMDLLTFEQLKRDYPDTNQIRWNERGSEQGYYVRV